MRLAGALPIAFLLAGIAGSRPGAARVAAAPPNADRTIAITIDDLPINGRDDGLAALATMNERLLAALKRYGVPAVGFVNESKLYNRGEVDGRIALLRAWVDQGLELGNHTYAHPSLNKVGPAAFEEDVLRGETVTRILLGDRKLRWFRHPFLEAGATAEDEARIDRFLEGRGYRVAPVTAHAWDWYYTYRYSVAKRRGDSGLMARVVSAYLDHLDADLEHAEALARRVFGREIPLVFLMHENELSAEHFDRVAERLKARGYRFVTLAAAMADPGYAHPDRFVGGGAGWLERWAATDGITDLPPGAHPPAWLEKLEADRSPYDPVP
jgi:peptidoglycan/xylan/chitin deacetylase (PgdA/CDA1 family)